MGDEPYVHYYDSLTFEPDSILVYTLVPIETSDTLYDRLEMIVKTDSLGICDSIPMVDTCSVIKLDSETVRPEIKRINKNIRLDTTSNGGTLNSSKELWQLSR